MQDQFRQPLRLKQGPDSKSKRQNLSGHGQSPKHPSSQELSVSIRTSATACVYEHGGESTRTCFQLGTSTNGEVLCGLEKEVDFCTMLCVLAPGNA